MLEINQATRIQNPQKAITLARLDQYLYLKNIVVLLRLFIGWHFLYEAVIKLYNPDWTAFGYLATAQGPLRGFYVALTNESLIGTVDMLNTFTLLFVGLTLTLGIFEKWGAFAGIGILALYYMAHPPFPGAIQMNVEGNYWFVNKILIELIACAIILLYPTGRYFGLGHLFQPEQKTLKTENP